MKQGTFTDIEYSFRKKKTKREEFLEIMNEIMQAQFSKDVLGVVRLAEAKAHKERSLAVKETIAHLQGEDRKLAKEEARQEQSQYSQIKRLRWTLLTKAESLSESRAAHLAEILDSHSNLAVCYAMKEEMCSLFDLRDPKSSLKC